MSEKPDESEKTEDPSDTKLEEARKKGDVPKSTEVPTLILLAMSVLIVIVLSGPLANMTADAVLNYFRGAGTMPTDPKALHHLAIDLTLAVLLVLAAPFLVLLSAGILGNVLQTGLIFSAEKMKPKASKLSPVAGLGRMFGKPALGNFLKGIGKMVVVAVAGGLAVWPLRDQLVGVAWAPIGTILSVAKKGVVLFGIAALAVYAIIALIDLIVTRQSWMQKQRMTRREQKDEHKNQEGDPIVKNRLRQIRMQRARQRMMAAVPDATVVIANPTHYAVALKYEDGSREAPLCVARGVDLLALRIRQIAEANDVPVVENPPLARALYASMDIDQRVPLEHFAAVAKVIGYVLKLARKRAQNRSSG